MKQLIYMNHIIISQQFARIFYLNPDMWILPNLIDPDSNTNCLGQTIGWSEEDSAWRRSASFGRKRKGIKD